MQPDPRSDRLARAARELERWGSARDWTGTDPYEGLNAARLGLLKRSALGRRILIQLVKRSPLDLRPALGIRAEPNPAALAHVLSAYSRPGWMPEADRLAAAKRTFERLITLRAPAFDAPCWAYPFDVESRVFFYPRTTPNTIASAFCGLALLELAGSEPAREPFEVAQGVGEFFLRDVGLNESSDGGFFGYFPGDRTPIHNASLLAGGFLARLGAATGRRDFREAAQAAARYALAHQRPDGSWPYGERDNLQWVDNFHTGYVLDSLHRCIDAIDVPGLAAAVDRGLDYYAAHLFLDDGTPKYMTDRVHPIDAQCVAQATATFALASSRDRSRLESAWKISGYGLDSMRRADGAFAFQRRRMWVNRTPHVRWVQAPMLDAITLLLEAANEGGP